MGWGVGIKCLLDLFSSNDRVKFRIIFSALNNHLSLKNVFLSSTYFSSVNITFSPQHIGFLDEIKKKRNHVVGMPHKILSWLTAFIHVK